MLDFGEGFYTTSNKEQAKRWAELVSAKHKTNTRVITEYKFDYNSAKKECKVITFVKPDSMWLDFVCKNRSGSIPVDPYDIVIGPVANDQVYTVVVLYEQGIISKEAAITELKVRKLYNQILFHTDKSLGFCHYLNHIDLGGK